MKIFLPICLFFICLLPALAQKAEIKVTKGDNNSLSGWQILDEQHNKVFSGYEYSQDNSVSFTLEANKRYLFQISVFEVHPGASSLYTLSINNEPLIRVEPFSEPGDRVFNFFSGTKTQDTKIVGGTNALIADFPWQVYLIAGDYACGGSIINENWILTAAHCTKDEFGSAIPAAQMAIKVGATNPFVSSEGKVYYISEVIVNQDYDNQTYNNDIALLRLSQPINFPDAKPIKLISSDEVSYGMTDPGVMSWVTGWGLTRVSPEIYPSVLQKVQLPIVSISQASTVWKDIPPSDLMAGFLNGNKDACNGDSGGPLVVPVFDEYKLAGIVSWGSEDCDTYGAYTRVSDFENWIRLKTGILKEFRPPAPLGDTIICQGTVSSDYSISNIPGATAYEWKIWPAEAGIVSGSGENASVLWNQSFLGAAELTVRLTLDGIVSEWSRLKLNVVLDIVLLGQSSDTTICAQEPVRLQVVATGYKLTYKWFKNGVAIPSGTSSQLNISNSETGDSGEYTCEISSYCGTILSLPIKLTVLPLTNITYISPDRSVPFGADTEIEVVSEGHELTYQWIKDNLSFGNFNSARLALYDLNAGDIGLYQAIVTGTCGTQTSNNIYVYVRKSDYKNESEVFLWPTITSGKVNIAVSNDDQYSISLFNSSGKLVKKLSDCRYQTIIDLTTMPGGMYFVTIFNYNIRSSFKLIKQ